MKGHPRDAGAASPHPRATGGAVLWVCSKSGDNGGKKKKYLHSRVSEWRGWGGICLQTPRGTPVPLVPCWVP